MAKIFTKKQIFTIPNLLSLCRLLLIPFIIWLYVGKKQYFAAVLLIAISGLTDIADGYIARHFNMVSDVGKILDPVADKLTQLAVLLCLTVRYRLMVLLDVLFAVKEVAMALMGLYTIKKKAVVNSAKWYGKANTVILYAEMAVLILFEDIPLALVNALIIVCCVTLVISLFLYIRFYRGVFSGQSGDK